MNVDVLRYSGVSYHACYCPTLFFEIAMRAWEDNLRYAYIVMVTCIGRRLQFIYLFAGSLSFIKNMQVTAQSFQSDPLRRVSFLYLIALLHPSPLFLSFKSRNFRISCLCVYRLGLEGGKGREGKGRES